MHDIFTLGYSIHMAADEVDTAEVSLYGQIVENMPKFWKWSEEDKSAAEFKKAIDDVKQSGANKLLVRINSPGGVCTEAVAMRSILANAGFDEINIMIEGLCASAATTIATIPDAHVSIAEGSEYMIHNPWTFTYGNANELEHTVERLRNIEQMSRVFYAKKTGQTEEQIKEWMDAETWFTAEQAVEYGFADELLSAELPAVACATSREMAVMHKLYNKVPDDVKLVINATLSDDVNTEFREEVMEVTYKDGTIKQMPFDGTIEDFHKVLAQAELEGKITQISEDTPVAGKSPENKDEEENVMELENLTIEQLREANPALFEQVSNNAVDAERERLSDIDALTMPGYEDLAKQAKENGTSVIDFQKQLVAAMKQKGNDFLQARQAETEPAKEVAGGEPVNLTADQEIESIAKEVAEYAAGYRATGDTMF